MAWTRYQLMLSALLVVTGSLNTLTTKWADKMQSKSSDGNIRYFNHPFTQALVMFLGEILCLVSFYIFFAIYSRRNVTSPLVEGSRDFKPWIFFIPAFLDMIATSLMYVGLTLTYASSFQMLRGSLIAFVAALRLTFLHKTINSRELFGIFFVILGLVVVGVADFSSVKKTTSLNNVLTGDLLIVMAQLISAGQMVYEEHYIIELRVPPLLAVGWEGIFGFCSLALLHIPMYFIFIGHPFSDNPRGVVEDFPDAMIQIWNNPMLFLPIVGTIISIAFFNFASISITKELSAATRSVLDSVRTFFIWMASIGLKWQAFSPIQIVGFILLLLGMCIYNDLYATTVIRSVASGYNSTFRRPPPEREILISEEADHHGDTQQNTQ